MRLALKVYYNGRDFHGSQIQPRKRTVEGELLKSLEKLGIAASNFQRAARTDRGVSALGNVYAFDADKDVSPRALNSFLPRDIRVLSAIVVPAGFNPRFGAQEKVYKYFLYDEGYSLRKMREAAMEFQGKHSFHNFSIIEKKNPIRKISRVEVKRHGDIFVLAFRGESFLWQMVRRVVTALKLTGKGALSRTELRKYFDPAVSEKFPPSQAEGLVLWEIKYPFKFSDEEYSTKQLSRAVKQQMIKTKTTAALEEAIWGELKIP